MRLHGGWFDIPRSHPRASHSGFGGREAVTGAKLPRSSAQPRTKQAGEWTKLLDLPATCPEALPCAEWTVESRAELKP